MAEPEVAEIRATTAERPKVRAVREMMHRGGTMQLRVGSEDVELPSSLVRSLMVVADSLEEGDTVAIVREEAEVSPAEAAKILGVSRQYVDRLVAGDVLPTRRLPNSTYRKIPVRAVLAFKSSRDKKREAIRAIVDEATAAGLDY